MVIDKGKYVKKLDLKKHSSWGKLTKKYSNNTNIRTKWCFYQ